MSDKLLKPTHLAAAAKRLRCDLPAIQAVAEVESPQGGFIPGDGRPTILFEAHIFSRLTHGRYDATYPNISSPKWNRQLYGATGVHQHDRLNAAAYLDRSAALQAASWGRFQLMGFNYKVCGYPVLQTFINAMYRSEGDQLNAFVGYVIARGLDDELRAHDWHGFAYGYNGTGYASNRYDTKLAAAYRKFSK